MFQRTAKKGQAAYSELARHGLFEGGGSYPRSLCLTMMKETNPYRPGSRKHKQWEGGWRERAGLGGYDVPA